MNLLALTRRPHIAGPQQKVHAHLLLGKMRKSEVSRKELADREGLAQ